MFWINGESMALNIYVDDLSLAGPADLRKGFGDSLRKRIEPDPETKIEDGSRVLGRRQAIHRSPSQTTAALDMRAYADQVVELYLELSGLDRKRLRKVPTRCLAEVSITGDDLAVEGELGSVHLDEDALVSKVVAAGLVAS